MMDAKSSQALGPNHIRLIAFYLPQFHPIPENEAWWGKGFTEWTNVAAAKPLFPGHDQPRLPADLGFYDLRLPEVRLAQAALAREYGIYGFCYYHYWFNGKLLLERPFNEVLASGEPDFPFCLCWANENWTQAWDGLDQHVLIEQKYGPEDDRRHMRWLANAFQDKRYIRIDGKPLFLVYRISKIPNPLRTASNWREEAQKLGIGEIYLATVESLRDDRVDPIRIGFDAAVEFQPDWLNLGDPLRQIGEGNLVYDYGSLVERMLQKNQPSYKRFPCVTPTWDNTPRRTKNAFLFKDSTPELYQKWLQSTIENYAPPSSEENLIFINAWNEWAEGAYLEPCQKWGRAYLEATRRALDDSQVHLQQPTPIVSGKSIASAARVSVCIPTYNGAKYLGEAITSVLNQTLSDFELIIVDDCSTDTTEAVIKSFSDNRIKYFKNPVHLGLVGNWNKCIELSSGQYVYIFHQDDVMMPENLEEKARVLEENPTVGMVHSNVHQIGPEGELISEWWYFKPDLSRDVIQSGFEYFKTLLLGPNIVSCPSVMVRRKCYEHLGGFDSQLPFTADWEMWMRIALFYDVAYLAKSLVKYRRHERNETLNFVGVTELEHYYRAKKVVLEKYAERIHNSDALRLKVAQQYKQQALEQALNHYRQGQYAMAREYLAFAIDVHRTIADQTSVDEYVDWFLEIVEQMWRQEPQPDLLGQSKSLASEKSHQPLYYQPIYRQVVDLLSSADIAQYISTRKLIGALGFKIATKPGFRWLYRYRGWVRKVLGL